MCAIDTEDELSQDLALENVKKELGHEISAEMVAEENIWSQETMADEAAQATSAQSDAERPITAAEVAVLIAKAVAEAMEKLKNNSGRGEAMDTEHNQSNSGE